MQRTCRSPGGTATVGATLYAKAALDLARWLEGNIPQGMAIFGLHEQYRLKMRTSSPIERAVQQEIK